MRLRWRRLSADLFPPPVAPLAAGCAECRANLDLLLDGWLEGLDIRRTYPRWYAHLQVCVACRGLARSLVELAEPP